VLCRPAAQQQGQIRRWRRLRLWRIDQVSCGMSHDAWFRPDRWMSMACLCRSIVSILMLF
jgi:hypothetical protein